MPSHETKDTCAPTPMLMCSCCRWFSGRLCPSLFVVAKQPFDAIPSLLFAAICVQLWVLSQTSKCITDTLGKNPAQCSKELSSSLSTCLNSVA